MLKLSHICCYLSILQTPPFDTDPASSPQGSITASQEEGQSDTISPSCIGEQKLEKEEEEEGAGVSEQEQIVERQEEMDGTSQPSVEAEEEEEDRAEDELDEMEEGLQMIKGCTEEEKNMEEEEGGRHVEEGSEEEECGCCDAQRGENQHVLVNSPPVVRLYAVDPCITTEPWSAALHILE